MAKVTVKQPKLSFRKLKSMSSHQIAALLPGGTLSTGGHDLTEEHPETGEELKRPIPEAVCLMEAVAWVTGEPHSDAPRCADPTLTAVGVDFNDSHYDGDSDYNDLVASIPALVGSKTGSARVRFKRAKRAAQLLLERFISKYEDEGDDGDVGMRVLEALREVSGIRSYKECVKAADLLSLLVADEYDDLFEAKRALDALVGCWNHKGISGAKYREVVSWVSSKMFVDGPDQARFLTEVGYIRS